MVLQVYEFAIPKLVGKVGQPLRQQVGVHVNLMHGAIIL
jgi:hypothetical protein